MSQRPLRILFRAIKIQDLEGCITGKYPGWNRDSAPSGAT
jgi:hypothetical protein